MALSRAASATARPYHPEQRHQVRHTLERMIAALFRNKQSRDLPLHPRRDQNRAGLGQRLHPRSDGLQQLFTMAQRCDANVLEVVVGQPAQQVAVNVVGPESLGILGDRSRVTNQRCPSSTPSAPVSSCF